MIIYYFIFIILAFLFTYPLIFKITSSIYGFLGFHGDPFATLWWIWWYGYAWSNKLAANVVPIVGYPFGVNLAERANAPLLNYPVAGLNFLIKNEILTYNITVLAGIILTTLCAFYLVRYLTKNNNAAFLGAIIFGFCPNQLMHSAQHLNFTLNFWIPLFILFLFKLKDDPNFKNAFLCGIIGACMTLTNYYFGYFMLIFCVLFLIYWLLTVKKGIKYLFLSGLIGFCIVLPFIARLFFRQAEGGFYGHPMVDLFKYCAHWLDYFLPSEFHPIFGGVTREFDRHYFERSLYIGYLPLLLAGIGIIGVKRKAQSAKQRNIIMFFLCIAFLFFILSLNPIFNVASFKIPNLSYIIYKILPMFRVYARMGFLVLLSVSVLVGFGLKYIVLNIKNNLYKNVVTSFFICFVLFEFLIFPPFHNIDISKIPEVYAWLAKQPSAIIVEYPFDSCEDESNSDYIYYQTIHKKNLVNGANIGSLSDAFRGECQYLERLETAKLLAYLGADYVIVHRNSYSPKQLGDINKNPGLTIAEDFLDAVVYKVKCTPDKLVTIFWKNFGSWEKWGDGNYWRWMGNNATVYIGAGPREIRNPKSEIRNIKITQIEFKILSFAKNRDLEIYINDLLIKKIYIPVQSDPNKAQKTVLKNIVLQPGENVIRFYTPQGEDRIGDVLKNADERKVSFAITDFEIKE